MMFTFMLLILLYIFSQFFAIVGLINLDIANINMPIPITIYEVSNVILLKKLKLIKRYIIRKYCLSVICSRCTNLLRIQHRFTIKRI